MMVRRGAWRLGTVAWLAANAWSGVMCDGTSLRASFEKGFDADEGFGDLKATLTGAAARVADRYGTSLVLGPGLGSCAYAAKGNLSLDHGSLIAWLQPTGWKREGTKTVPLISASSDGASLSLWWQASDATLVLARRQADGKTAAVAKPAYDWGQPTWRHLILTWSLNSLSLYVDGQPGRAAPKSRIQNPKSEIVELGGDFGPGATLSIRGVTILTEPFSPEGVLARYRVAVSGRVEHERPSLTVGSCRQPPAIDGKLSEGEWDSAAGTSGFAEMQNGTLSSVETRVYLSYDEKNLYLACRCPFAGTLVGRKYERDNGAPWEEDCFEVFLQPEVGFTAKSYHAILNSAGSLYDLEDQSAAWNGVSQWAADRGDNEWTGEMVVPHASLGTLPPKDGTKWQANFCRSIGEGATQYRHTHWAFTGGGPYGVWQFFGSLRFSPTTPVARLESLTAQPHEGASLQLRVANSGAGEAKVVASVLLYRAGMAEDTEERAVGPWHVAPGESRTESFKAAAGFPVDQVKVQVKETDSAAVLLSQMVRAGALAPVAPTAAVTPPPSDSGAVPLPRLTAEMLEKVRRERALWENNRLGVTDKVPPPWTPMKVSSESGASGRKGKRPLSISCWGRTYDYTESLLPGGVTSHNAEILAGPVALAIRTGGREALAQKAGKQTVVSAPSQVDLTAAANLAGITVRAKSHLEYDGCIKVELSLSPAGRPVKIEGLELRVPVKAERALYYHWFEATRDPRRTNAGSLPAEGLKSHFKPLLWLGDDDRGLCWFCESPKGWQVNGKESVLCVERQRNAATMRVTMMDRPFELKEEWRVVFGLMATPTRPMPKGWRDWLIPLNQSNPWSSWAPGFNNLSGTDDPGTLTPRDPEAMRQWVKQIQEKGWPAPYLPMQEPTKVIPYSQIVFWSGKHRDGMPSPEIKLLGPEWSNRNQPPGPRKEPDDQIPLKEYYWVCPGSSFAQFYIHKLNQLIDQTGIDGIYIDGPWNTCSNAQHGCGYKDDNGQWQMEYKIWPFRELLKRVYCLFYDKRKSPVIHHHTSCWLCIPSISFSHMMLDGEQYHDAGQKVEDHFMDIVPLDKWRAEHTGRQWGPAPFLLPDIPPQWCKPEAPTRELLMLTNLHDTAVFPGNLNLRLFMRNYQARRLFGVAGCEFRGYWGSGGPSRTGGEWVKCETPEVCVSAYRKPDGSRCLLIVGNTAKADAIATVRLSFSGLKLKAATTAGVDLETSDKIPIRNGVMTVPMKARDFRLIALPFYAAPPITAGDVRASALKEIPNPGFENGLTRWSAFPIEGNTGRITVDKETKFSGAASCHLHKADGPGGVMVQTDDVFLVETGKKYRATCMLKIANSTGAQAYWMISAMDGEGNSVLTNNLFHGFIKRDQDWMPLPFEFPAPAGAVVLRLHFLVAFPGVADAWVDEFRLEEVK